MGKSRLLGCGLGLGGSQQLAGAGFLHECDKANVLGVDAGFDFQLNVLREGFSF